MARRTKTLALTPLITSNPRVRFGAATVAGTGIKAVVVGDLYHAERDGRTHEETVSLVAEWFSITPGQVEAAATVYAILDAGEWGQTVQRLARRVLDLREKRDVHIRSCESCRERNAPCLVAHNATFDRGFFERAFGLEPRRWACTMQQIDWHAIRRMPKCRHLRHLAFELGVRPSDAHRAHSDVETLVEVLKAAHPLTGERIAHHLIQNATAPYAFVRAVAAPFESKDTLKAAGWSWSVATRVWWRTVPEAQLTDLSAWMLASVYGGDEHLAGQKRCTLGVDPLRPDFEEAYGLR